MQLKSRWFSGNARLERCLVSDPDHVLLGDQGVHVLLIQEAIMMLDGVSIDAVELDGFRYGPSTAAATLAYKRKRNIVNRAYQTTADDIVGKMTMASLDQEMVVKERLFLGLTGLAAPRLTGLFFSPSVKSNVKAIVVTETNSPWVAWARNFKKTFSSIGADVVEIANSASPQIVTHRLKLAATMAGPGGFLILSVGHGGLDTSFSDTEGFFDLGPHHTFRVGGQNAILPGDPPPKNSPKPPKPVHVSAFYDFRVPNASQKNGFIESRKDHDEASTHPSAKIRLSHWKNYEDMAKSFQGLSGVILLTCKVAGATGFLTRVRQQWGTPIIGYGRRVMGQVKENGRTRIFLEGDAEGTGTNTPFGEFLFPLSRDMVVI